MRDQKSHGPKPASLEQNGSPWIREIFKLESLISSKV